jgi:hypothetical protein
LRGLGGLAVDDGDRWACFTPGTLARARIRLLVVTGSERLALLGDTSISGL